MNVIKVYEVLNKYLIQDISKVVINTLFTSKPFYVLCSTPTEYESTPKLFDIQHSIEDASKTIQLDQQNYWHLSSPITPLYSIKQRLQKDMSYRYGKRMYTIKEFRIN